MRTMSTAGVTLLTACIAALLLPGAAAASDTSGFMLGLDLGTSHIGAEDPDPNAPSNAVFVEETGGQVSFLAGYGFTRSFALRMNASGGQHDTSDPDTEFWLNSVTVEGMYVFRDPQPFRPYIFGGVGGFTMRSRQADLDFETSGPGGVLGIGLAYFAGERFAFDFAVRGDFINWDTAAGTLTLPGGSTVNVDIPIEEEGSAAKFLFGVNWWFGKGS